MYGLHHGRAPETVATCADAQNDSDGQSLPTFCAAGVDDFATVFGLHTCAKTVGAFSGGIVWLVCAFHLYTF
jgi:hypothetical protein